MALKLPDSAVPMGDFPVAKAVDIDFDDGENLQEKLDNGTLGGGVEGVKTYTSLSELELTAEATFQDVIDTLPKGSSALFNVKEFTNYPSIFPYEGTNDQFARVHIVKGVADGSCMYARWFRKDGGKEAIAIFNTNDNKFNGWQQIQAYNSKATLITNTTTLKLDVTKMNGVYYGAIKLTYLYDTSPVEVEISFRSATDDLRWAVINGQKYIKQITFTQDSSNTAHYTIGIEFIGTTYGCYQAEVIGGFANINSLTSEAFTGEKTAVYYSPWGKNNGVTLVSAPEDIGLTFPCTSVQLVIAMRDKFKKTIYAGAIGIFNCELKAKTITDAPSDFGLLHIETFGSDRVLIRFDGISGANYAGSWVGQIKSTNGTFSSVTWSRLDNGSRISELEADVDELFQSVSSGKTLVANAITDKGVSTSTSATFATMATNISKIPQTTQWKEETVSASADANSRIAKFVFSNTVLGVRQLTASGYHYIAEVQEAKMFTITTNYVEVYLPDGGTWQMTAMVWNSTMI